MTDGVKVPTKFHQHALLIIIGAILILSLLVGCEPSTEDLEAVKYTPLPGGDWKVSTPHIFGITSLK